MIDVLYLVALNYLAFQSSEPGEGYSRNKSCALNHIYIFVFISHSTSAIYWVHQDNLAFDKNTTNN
jgi:hypothetical protein